MSDVRVMREEIFNYLEIIASSSVRRESINPEYIVSVFKISSEEARQIYLEWLSLYRPHDEYID
jgi:hypothetical protein